MHLPFLNLNCFSKKIILLLILSIANGIANIAFAQTQDDQKQFYIETNKGRGYLGTIIDKSSKHILFKTKKEKIKSIPLEDIRSVSELNPNQIVGRSYWPKQPQATLQNGTPNAFNLKEGEIHILNSYGALNQINIGFTNNFSLVLGTAPIGIFSKEPSVVWMAPKYTFPTFKKWFNIGVGLNAVANYESRVRGNPFLVGYPYLVFTLGGPNANISYSVGAPFYDYGWDDSEGANTISASLRTSKRTYLRMESYLFKYNQELEYTITWIGLKHIWTRYSMDYGVLLSVEPGYGTFVIPAPFLSVTYSFQNAPSNIHLVK